MSRSSGQLCRLSEVELSFLLLPNPLFLIKSYLSLIFKKSSFCSTFCHDNHVLFELHAYFFLAKDYLGIVAYHGPLNNGLHSFSVSLIRLQLQSLSSIHASANVWHRNLSHSSLPIIKEVSCHQVANKKHSVCLDCQMVKSHTLHFKSLYVSNFWGPTPI